MIDMAEAVREFHVKHGFPVDGQIDPAVGLVRTHLIAEELSELSLGLAERDLTKVADAVADLAYVVVGTAVAFGLPLASLFEEVHRSNMTKAVRRPGDTRLRDKGESWIPADIAKVLREAGLPC